MNISKNLLALPVLMLFISCAKNAPDLINLAQSNLDKNQEDDAIKNLNTLLDNYPNDSLASYAQYKLASIYKNWKNDPENLIEALEKTINNYPNSLHSKQAKKEKEAFQGWIINNAETLRKRKMTIESINNLDYLVKNFPKHELASKAQYIVGDIYIIVTCKNHVYHLTYIILYNQVVCLSPIYFGTISYIIITNLLVNNNINGLNNLLINQKLLIIKFKNILYLI